MDDFDGSILAEEDVAGFFSGADGYHDDEALAEAVKEARYFDEIAEIERLREKLKTPRLAGQYLNQHQIDKGISILAARRRAAESMFDGPPPKPVKVSPPWSPARMAAQEAGLIKYQEGTPCVHGHNSPRYVKNAICVACMAECKAKRRAEHPEKM